MRFPRHRSEKAALARCGEYFMKHKANAYARETFLKMGGLSTHVI